MKFFTLICIFASFFNFAFAQKILLLEKPGTINNVKYKIGDGIDLSTDQKQKISGIISNIGDSIITVNYSKVKISEIRYINKRNVFPSILSGIGIQGGLAYVGIDLINNVINNETPYIRKSTLKTGAYSFGIGIIANLFIKNKRKIDGKKWRLTVLDFDK